MKVKNKKASVLVATMIILGAIIVISLTISLASIRAKKDAVGSGRSGQAYQAAEEGIEAVMDSLLNADPDALVSSIGSCSKPAGSNYAIISDANYKVELRKQDESLATNCNVTVKEIAVLKSTGSDAGGQDQRAIEASVSISGKGCYISYKDGCSGANCCLSGFGNLGSVGSWGYCHGCTQSDCTSWFVPPGGDCNFAKTNNGVAYLCCSS